MRRVLLRACALLLVAAPSSAQGAPSVPLPPMQAATPAKPPPPKKAPQKPTAKKAAPIVRATDSATRRQIAGGPSAEDALLGPDSAELRALHAAERELFPMALPSA